MCRLTLDTAKPATPQAPKRAGATATPSSGNKKKQEKKSGGGLDLADYLTLGKYLTSRYYYKPKLIFIKFISAQATLPGLIYSASTIVSNCSAQPV